MTDRASQRLCGLTDSQ